MRSPGAHRTFPISIHAPRTGSDQAWRWRCWTRKNFNPRSPHGERLFLTLSCQAAYTFQSTLPARGATAYLRRSRHPRLHFNPRSPHGERHCPERFAWLLDDISIHAPRTGSDRAFSFRTLWRMAFQSTLPARGATRDSELLCNIGLHFNPRSPHGERPFPEILLALRLSFQSTLPARGATFFNLRSM